MDGDGDAGAAAGELSPLSQLEASTEVRVKRGACCRLQLRPQRQLLRARACVC
jgi:hypothetical protein